MWCGVVCVCVVSGIGKHPVLPPCAVDGHSRNLFHYYFCCYTLWTTLTVFVSLETSDWYISHLQFCSRTPVSAKYSRTSVSAKYSWTSVSAKYTASWLKDNATIGAKDTNLKVNKILKKRGEGGGMGCLCFTGINVSFSLSFFST